MAGGVLFQPGVTVTLEADVVSKVMHMPRQGGTVRIVNPSSRSVWLEWGDYGVKANTTTSVQMLPGTTVQFRLPRAALCMAAVTTAGAGADKGAAVPLNITFGEGS
jgi:hypothetical protein